MESTELVVEQSLQRVQAIRNEIGKVIVGQSRVLDELMVCVLLGKHALLEGVPGVGKTTMIKTLADLFSLDFSRIQCTPDLMPADIIGTNVLVSQLDSPNEIQFRKGPLFTNLLLADEVNRATPKTQSALLEAMQEHQVTVGIETYSLPEPFLVLATQNPIEMEGTYPLPEAQLDRFFFKIRISPPSETELLEILERTTVPAPYRAAPVASLENLHAIRRLIYQIPAADEVKEYAVRIISASHQTGENDSPYIRYGASPRGAQTLLLAGKAFAFAEGRLNLGFEDIRRAALPALRHRLILTFRAEAEGVRPEALIAEILKSVPELK
ncbi:MAG: AAA family ATPase [Spirochaetota bacterium]